MGTNNSMWQGNGLRDKLPELGKEWEKSIIIWNTKKWLQWLRMALLAWWVAAIIWASDPAQANKTEEYALLAANWETMLVKKWPELATPEQIKEIAKITKMAPVVVETILSMSEKNRLAILKWELWENSVLRVEVINNINQLVNTWDKIPTKNMFKPISEANYKEIVAELFNTSDIDEWLRNPDGTPYDDAQKNWYRTSQKKIEDRYMGRADEFKKDFWEKALQDWFKLYNEWAPKLPRQWREFLRRLFTSASSIIFFDNTTDQMRTKSAPGMAAQMWEYLILTGQGRISIAKVEFWERGKTSFKYLLPSETQIRETWFNIRHDLSNIVIQDMTKYHWGELHSGQLTKEAAGLKQEAAQLDRQIIQSKRSAELNKKTWELWDKIIDLIKEFVKNPTNKTLENDINKKIKELRDIKITAEKELRPENLIAIRKMVDVMESMYIPQFEKLKQQKS